VFTGQISLLSLDDLTSSSDSTGSSGGNESDLLSSWGVSSSGSWVTNVLMVTSSVRMLDWVHGNTSNSWPVPLLGVGSEVGSVGLKEWLVSSLTSSTDSDHTSAGALDGLSDSRWKSDSGLLSVLGVSDDDGGSSGSSSEGSTVSHLGLNVRDDSSLWHGGDWKNVADCKGSFGSSIDKLAGIHALNCDEKLSVLLEFVLVSENDLCERCATTWIVHNVLNNSLDVSSSFSKVQGSETSWGNSLRGVGLEDSATSTSL